MKNFFFKNNFSSGASNDIEMATYLAHLMVVNFGKPSEIGTIKYEKKTFLSNKSDFNSSEQTAYKIIKK